MSGGVSRDAAAGGQAVLRVRVRRRIDAQAAGCGRVRGSIVWPTARIPRGRAHRAILLLAVQRPGAPNARRPDMRGLHGAVRDLAQRAGAGVRPLLLARLQERDVVHEAGTPVRPLRDNLQGLPLRIQDVLLVGLLPGSERGWAGYLVRNMRQGAPRLRVLTSARKREVLLARLLRRVPPEDPPEADVRPVPQALPRTPEPGGAEVLLQALLPAEGRASAVSVSALPDWVPVPPVAQAEILLARVRQPGQATAKVAGRCGAESSDPGAALRRTEGTGDRAGAREGTPVLAAVKDGHPHGRVAGGVQRRVSPAWPRSK